MTNFQLRVTRPFTDAFVLAMSQLAALGASTEWMVYEHEADEQVSRTHCHVYFFNWGLSEQSFRSYFKNMYGDLPKTDYALSTTAGRGKGPITLEYAVKYASKDGSIPVKFVRGFDKEQIHKIEEGYKKQPILAVHKEPRQMTKWKLVEICYEEAKQEAKVYNQPKLTKGQMVDLVVDVLLTHKQVFSTYKVIEIMETIAARDGDYEMAKEHIINSLKY